MTGLPMASHRLPLVLAGLLSALPGLLAAQTAPPGPTAGRQPAVAFASAVAIGDGEILVGRPGQAALLPMPPMETGAVHVFRRAADGSWAEAAALVPPGAAPGDGFGAALALDGDVLLVGSPSRDAGRGAAFVYERDGDGWELAVRLSAPEPGPGAFGAALAVRGEVALVGAPEADGGGAVHVFRRDDSGGWSAAGVLKPSAPEAGARFGAALDLGDARALVGAPGPSIALSLLGGGTSPRPGAAYLFAHAETDGWREAAKLTAPEGRNAALGTSVLLHDGTAFAGAPAADRGVGAVYRFARDAASGAWVAAGKLSPSATEPPALLGSSLAGAGADVLSGAPMAGGNAGAVHVFRAGAGGAWREVQRLQVEPTGGIGMLFGFSVAGWGDHVAAGAPVAAFFEGVGYLFSREAGAWRAAGEVAGGARGLAPMVGGEVRCEEGRAGLFPCEDVDLLAFLPVSAIGGGRGIMVNDLWGWTDPETGREYAIVGRVDGTSFVDVTDPSRPTYLGDLPLTAGAMPNLWRDMKVYADHVFVVADGAGEHGIQIFDLTRLRTAAGSAPVTFTETAHYDGIHSAHNIVVNEETGFVYAVGASGGGETCGGGLHAVDVRDPARPRFAGCFADPTTGNAGTGYTHDAQCVVYRGPDEEHRGREICFGSNETALSIADVTDKANPVPLSAAAYPNVGYAHQGWLSDDHRFFYLDDELDEVSGLVERTRTLVWDVQDLDDPVLVAEHLGTTGASDHNLYVRGRYMYQSNYVSGLRILDLSDPKAPREVGFFDTVPLGEDAPGFAGSWSNYPYFESGTIAVTSMREGLFLLRKREGKPVS